MENKMSTETAIEGWNDINDGGSAFIGDAGSSG